jgi:hypothetical protein
MQLNKTLWEGTPEGLWPWKATSHPFAIHGERKRVQGVHRSLVHLGSDLLFRKALNNKIINVNLKLRYFWLWFPSSFGFNNWESIRYEMFDHLVKEQSRTNTNYYMYIN